MRGEVPPSDPVGGGGDAGLAATALRMVPRNPSTPPSGAAIPGQTRHIPEAVQLRSAMNVPGRSGGGLRVPAPPPCQTLPGPASAHLAGLDARTGTSPMSNFAGLFPYPSSFFRPLVRLRGCVGRDERGRAQARRGSRQPPARLGSLAAKCVPAGYGTPPRYPGSHSPSPVCIKPAFRVGLELPRPHPLLLRRPHPLLLRRPLRPGRRRPSNPPAE